MKSFDDMTPMERLAFLSESGVTLFPNLSDEDKRAVLYVQNEPVTSAQYTHNGS